MKGIAIIGAATLMLMCNANAQSTSERPPGLTAPPTRVEVRQGPRPRWKDELWAHAIDLSVTASWAGFPQCVPHYEEAQGIYQPLEGWGIIEQRTSDRSSNNGSYETGIVAGGGKFISEADLDLSYSVAIDLAVKAGKLDIAANLRQQYAEHRASRRSWESNKNTVTARAWAKAHGDCTNQKRGWQELGVDAHLVYIGSPNAGELLRNLLEDNGLVSQDMYDQLRDQRRMFGNR